MGRGLWRSGAPLQDRGAGGGVVCGFPQEWLPCCAPGTSRDGQARRQPGPLRVPQDSLAGWGSVPATVPPRPPMADAITFPGSSPLPLNPQGHRASSLPSSPSWGLLFSLDPPSSWPSRRAWAASRPKLHTQASASGSIWAPLSPSEGAK